jgi:branched-chain amino acid aminotransferase
MVATLAIPVKRNPLPRIQETDFSDLEFGRHVSDHMLVCDYDAGHPLRPGWQTPQIVPYQDLQLDPASLALHYGQTVFEGMKAFRMDDGRINIFRIEKHYERFVRSLHRMCMAIPPKELFIQGLKELVSLDRDWVPGKPGQALYIRPFVYASEARFGVKVSSKYRFLIITGPVPELYASPIKVKVETEYIRAARGGTGFAKCGGNYGASFYPTQLAREQGYEQVLWTDATEHAYIEESGMMNAMFIIGNKLVTPPLSDSILDGVTRDSLLALCGELGITPEERKISIYELEEGFRNKTLTEAFGAGTAAVIAPIGVINIHGMDYSLPAYGTDSVSYRLKKKLSDIRTGISADIFEWNTILKNE